MSDATIVSSSSYFVPGRRMISRKAKGKIRVLSSLQPGTSTAGCFVCCSAPAFCPMLSICPCCNESEYIHIKKESSKYIYIRENSIEWNDPSVVMKHGSCCGIDPCIYEIQDDVKVVYFDDNLFTRITDQTRCCNELRTCLFGGRGERIQLDSPCCCNLFQRATFPCPCVPICCPTALFPCQVKHAIYVEEAQKGKYEIEQIRKLALSDSLYYEETTQSDSNGNRDSSVFEFEQKQRNGNSNNNSGRNDINNSGNLDISNSTSINTKINGGNNSL